MKPASSVHLCQGLANCGLWTCGISTATGHSPSYFLSTAAEPAQCSRPAAAGFHLPQHLEATRRVTWEQDPGGYSGHGRSLLSSAIRFGPLLRGQHALHLGDCLSQAAEASIYTAQLLQLRMLQSKYLTKETLIDCRIVCRLSHVKVHRSLTAAVVAAAVCHFPGAGL